MAGAYWLGLKGKLCVVPRSCRKTAIMMIKHDKSNDVTVEKELISRKGSSSFGSSYNIRVALRITIKLFRSLERTTRAAPSDWLLCIRPHSKRGLGGKTQLSFHAIMKTIK